MLKRFLVCGLAVLVCMQGGALETAAAGYATFYEDAVYVEGNPQEAGIDALGVTDATGEFEYTVLEDGTVEIKSYVGSEVEVIIPAQLDGLTVTSIGRTAFYYANDDLASIVLPETITNIGDWAFATTGITNIELPESVKKIGDYAFYYCEHLSEIYIPGNVSEIGIKAFGLCHRLADITVSEENPAYATEGNILYTKDKTTLLRGGSEVQTVVVCEGVTHIGAHAFNGCNKLEKVILPEGVTEIGSGAFINTAMLTEIVLPESLEVIADSAFGSKLEALFIPKNVVSIGAGALNLFAGNITVDEENTCYMAENNILYNKAQTELIRCASSESVVVVADEVKKIGDNAFGKCTSVEMVVLPEGLEEIGAYAFEGCNALTEITIPKGVTKMNKGVFQGCSALAEVVVLSEACEIAQDENVFPKAAVLHGYQDSTIQAYAQNYEREFEALPEKIEFEDVEAGAYYEEAVEWAVAGGITNGYGSETTFCPNITCTRGQIVTFLWRAKGCPEPVNLNNPFTDVTEDFYYYKAVLWAVEQGITNGYGSDTIFNPEGECTRGQVATFMWRASGMPEVENEENPFVDLEDEAYYEDAVLWAVEKGVTNGYGSAETFCPDRACTRGEIVTFLYRGMK